MTLPNVLIAFTCAIGLPVAALAQSPMQNMAPTADCCATDDGSAAAAAVLLPALTPGPAAAPCCQTGMAPAGVVDHSAHVAMPPTQPPAPMTPAMGAMACCDHGPKAAATATAAGCCQDMKQSCDMPCCAGLPPER